MSDANGYSTCLTLNVAMCPIANSAVCTDRRRPYLWALLGVSVAPASRRSRVSTARQSSSTGSMKGVTSLAWAYCSVAATCGAGQVPPYEGRLHSSKGEPQV